MTNYEQLRFQDHLFQTSKVLETFEVSVRELFLTHFGRLIARPEDIPRLNEAILQLAVQGKLVPQEPDDEPASALLARIREAKAEAEAKGDLRKAKPLPPIEEDEVPYSLPEGWVWVRLGNLMPQFQNGISKRKSTEGKDTVVLRLANIVNEEISLADVREIKLTSNERVKYDLVDGDILITRVNGSIDLVGSFTSVNVTEQVSYCDHFIRMRVDSSIIDTSYLVYAAKSELIRDQIKEKFITTAGQKTVNQRHISSLKFALPPLAEQKRIVAKVESLLGQTRALEEQLVAAEQERARLNKAGLVHLLGAQDSAEVAARWGLIAENFALLYSDPANVEELKQAILQLAVQGKLVPQEPDDEPASVLLERIRQAKAEAEAKGDLRKAKPLPPIKEDEVPYPLPEGWEWVNVQQIGEVIGGLTKNSKQRAGLSLRLPYLRVANVYADELRLDDLQEIGVREEEVERVILKKGDMLVVEGNGSIEQIGRVAIWDGSIDPCLHQNHLIKVRLNPVEIGEYLLHWFLSPPGREEITRVASTTTGLHTLSLSKVSALPVPLPPLAEQKRIVAKVESLLGLCEGLQSQLGLVEEERSRLLAAVLYGIVKDEG